jgi:anti-sigma B factor antagonist
MRSPRLYHQDGTRGQVNVGNKDIKQAQAREKVDTNMSAQKPVVVKQLPEQVKLGHIQGLLREIAPLLKQDRPRIVFDFSRVHQIDSAGVDMLLHCVEQVAHRDGDLKLAAVRPESAIILELTRVDRLFEIFDTVTEAVDSFDGFFHVHPEPGMRNFSASATNGTGFGQ